MAQGYRQRRGRIAEVPEIVPIAIGILQLGPGVPKGSLRDNLFHTPHY